MSARPRLGLAALVVFSLFGALAVPSAAVAANSLTSTPAPVVSGVAEVGLTLTSSTAPWAPRTVTKTYQWTRNGAPIAGATKSSYKLTKADAGKTVRLVVTGKKSGYTTVSKKSDPFVVLKYTSSPQATLSGEPVVGGQIYLRNIGWKPTPDLLAYQWSRDGESIPGETRPDFLPVESDFGSIISVRLTVNKAGYPTVVRYSPGVEIVRRIVGTPYPQLTGGTIVGDELSIDYTFTPADVATVYRWTRSGATIAGATDKTYTLTKADVGRSIHGFVTVSSPGYLTKTWQAEGFRKAHKTMTADDVTIAGPVIVGQRVNVDIGSWAPSTLTFSYEWSIDGVYFARRTKPYITVTESMLHGSELRVRVIGKKQWYVSTVRESNSIPIAP
jgi:hypothetical protein